MCKGPLEEKYRCKYHYTYYTIYNTYNIHHLLSVWEDTNLIIRLFN